MKFCFLNLCRKTGYKTLYFSGLLTFCLINNFSKMLILDNE